MLNNLTNIPGLDHIAIVVESIENGLKFYEKSLGLKVLIIETVESQGVKVAKLELNNTHIELLEPLAANNSIGRYLAKHGQGLHHICLSVNDVKQWLNTLDENKVCLINREPVTGSQNRKVAFVHPKSTNGVLLELSQV